jgi:methane monooxygenase component D
MFDTQQNEPEAACASKSDPEAILIYEESRYVAYGKDLEYMWRWEILRDGEFVQEGCSLTERSAREAVSHVISFFQRRDQTRDAKR